MKIHDIKVGNKYTFYPVQNDDEYKRRCISFWGENYGKIFVDRVVLELKKAK